MHEADATARAMADEMRLLRAWAWSAMGRKYAACSTSCAHKRIQD